MEFSLAAYQYLLSEAAYLLHAYGITVFVTVAGTALSLFITMLFAYPLSRKDYPLRKPVTFLVFSTMLFSGGLVPTYLLYWQPSDCSWPLGIGMTGITE